LTTSSRIAGLRRHRRRHGLASQRCSPQPEQQEVIALRFFNDCSLLEAAEALGKSVGAVKLLQHRALASLKKQLTRGER
jgi:DNA-directed RNA polymerase specialized sigma24 family protein